MVLYSSYLKTGSSVADKESVPEPSKQSSSSQGRSMPTTMDVGLGFGGRVGATYTGVIRSSVECNEKGNR